MARPNQVWYREDRGWWMVTLGGKKVRLIKGPDDEHHRQLAEEKFVELRKLRRIAPHSVGARTADIIEDFLKHSRLNHAPDTYRGHKYYCQLFAEHCGQVLARDLKPHHVTAWVSAMQSEERVAEGIREKERLRQKLPKGKRKKVGGNPRVWGPTSVYNARKTAFRVFSWAADEKLIPENPLAGMKRNKPPHRPRAITEDEFTKLYEYAGGPLRDVLLALYLTGARPKEVRDLRWFQVKADRWELDKHKTAHHGHQRTIFLPQPVREMMDRLRGNGSDHVFLNTNGEPWTTSALRQQVWRLKKKLGLPDDVCAYLCRHGFGTRAILGGLSGPTLAQLMGHSSQEMIKVYVHLADEHKHLAEAVEKVTPSMPVPVAPGPIRKRALPVNPKKPGPKPAATP